MAFLDDLDLLFSAQINANLWQDDPYYVHRAVDLGAMLGPDDWAELLRRRGRRDHAWMEKFVETLGAAGGAFALPLLKALRDDAEPAIADFAREALADRGQPV